jgi:hypothetical protein
MEVGGCIASMSCANSSVASSMISAARLLAHKTINGKYQTKMMMDEA